MVTGIVAIIAVTDDGKLLLVEQDRPPVGRRVIELPAGLAGDENGAEHEDLATAARRELREETGYDAAEMVRVAAGPPSAGMTDEVITLFRARGLRKVDDAGGVGSEQITLNGYWTNRVRAHMCALPPQPQGEIDVWCQEGEYGITERNEAIAVFTNDGRMFPAEGPHLTPWLPENIARVLMGGIMQLEVPPAPIVVDGHITVWDRPGLGVDFIVERAKAYLRPENAGFFD